MSLLLLLGGPSAGGPVAPVLSEGVALTEALTRAILKHAPPETVALTEALQVSAATLLPVTETWTAPDATGTMSGDHPWSNFIGTGQWQRFGGRARLTGTGSPSNQGGRMLVSLPLDSTVTLTVRQWSVLGSTAWLGVIARCPGDVMRFYEALILKVGTDYTLSIYRFNAGVADVIAGPVATTAPVPGTRLAIRPRGQVITLLRDGLPVIAVTDPAAPAGSGLDNGNFVGFLGGVGTAGGGPDQIEVDPLTVSSPVFDAPEAEALSLAEVLTRLYIPGIVTPLPVQETWTAPDAAGTLNGDHPWILQQGTGAWTVVSGAAQLQGTGGSMQTQVGRANLLLGTDNLRLTAFIEEWHDTGTGILVAGPMARMQGNGTLTGYAPILFSNEGVVTASIQRFMNGIQAQVGPSIPVVPHAGISVGVQCEADLISLYVDDVRVWNQNDPSGVLTGRFFGLEAVATSTNRVRVTRILAAPPSAVGAPLADALGLTETLRRTVEKRLAEGVSLTEAVVEHAVTLKPVGEAVGLAEVLTTHVLRQRQAAENVGLFESLGIIWQTAAPQVGEIVQLTESLVGRVSAKSPAETLALTEALGRVFRGQTRVGIIQLMDESVLVSGAGRRARVTASGVCLMPVPELSGLEYTCDLVGRDGVVVLPADLASLEMTLYNLGDLTLINGLNRVSALNLGKGTLSTAGRLVITLDAADCPIVDATKAYEHHVLLVEGSYDGAQRAFRRAIDHVVINMARVP